MRKGIILYQSKYGSAKKYAQWLKQETGYALMETKKAELHQLSNFDVIVLGGGVYASGIAGLQFLKKNISRLSDKKIAVFAVGASPYDEKAVFVSACFHLPAHQLQCGIDENVRVAYAL